MARNKLEMVSYRHSAQNNIAISNLLVRSVQSMSLYEKRLIMAAISAMDRKPKGVKISVEAFAQTYNIENVNNVYTYLKESVESLRTKYITVKDYVQKGKKTALKVTKINLVDFISYVDDFGYVELQFTSTMEPHICELIGKFTQYQLKQAANLRSIYSWRLLELLEQMKKSNGEGWLEIDLDEFLDAMQATATHRKNFGAVKQKIITPAIKELTIKDNWKIKFEPIKSSRKVVAVRFLFNRNEQGDLFSSENYQENPRTTKNEVKTCKDELRKMGILGSVIPDS